MERSVRQAMETASRMGSSQSVPGEQWWWSRTVTGWVDRLLGLSHAGWSDSDWLADRLASQDSEQSHIQGLPDRWIDCMLDQSNRLSERLVKLLPPRSSMDTVL